ncbi:MAG: SIMPL domain-containing protein [Candidatus Bilamarchaeaceae archaeon]
MECKECSYLLLAVAVAIVVLGGIYILTAAKPQSTAPYIYIIQNTSEAIAEHNTISTTGTAEEKLNPDMLIVSFDVVTEDKDARSAQSTNADKVNAIIGALKAMGIEDRDIKTTYYAIDEKTESHYVCRNTTDGSDCYWTTTFVGFSVTHSLSVNIYAMNKGGETADKIVENGGKIDSVSFSLKPETLEAAKRRLLTAASANAKAKAEAIASGTGATILRPLSLSEERYYTFPTYRSIMNAEGAPSVATQLAPGTMDVNVEVHAIFEIQ